MCVRNDALYASEMTHHDESKMKRPDASEMTSCHGCVRFDASVIHILSLLFHSFSTEIRRFFHRLSALLFHFI